MRCFADTEFNQLGGELISLGLVREDGRCLYLTFATMKPIMGWVKANVLPILNSAPLKAYQISSYDKANGEIGRALEQFFGDDDDITIVTDWPDDIKYISELLITGPGKMVNIPGIKFDMQRVDAYPCELEGVKQHNALWDAIALRYKLTGERNIDADWRPVKQDIPKQA